MARDTTNEKKDSWSAFHALMLSTPKAKGMRVKALSMMKTKIGKTIFFNLDFLAENQSK